MKKQPFKGIDLSSDTSTQPTMAMKKAMLAAPLGDEQKREDPTTRKLEELTADLLGQEDALFLPSATMGNIIAIRLLCQPGDELIAAKQSHIIMAEGGGAAVHSGVLIKPIQTNTGLFTEQDLHAAFRFEESPRYPASTAVSVENTTNLGGGLAWKTETLQAVLTKAKELKLKRHLDGARLCNAAIKMNVGIAELSQEFDTVTLCLSKGLGCPMGAVLAFKNNFSLQAERLKHLFGGAMRQSGMTAAAGIYALKNHIERLVEDHKHAEIFFKKLKSEIEEIRVEEHEASTNMVFFEWQGLHLSSDQFYQACVNQGLRFSRTDHNRFRAVMHLGVSRKDVNLAAEVLKKVIKN